MATTTITTTGAEDARIQPAFTNYLQLSSPATQAQIKAGIAAFVTSVVLEYERGIAARNAISGVAPIAPT